MSKKLISFIESSCKKIDLIGSDIGLKHHNNRKLKSFPGGIISLGIISFMIYTLIYFGRDMFEKKSPISRFTASLLNTSNIFLRDFPIAIAFTDKAGRFMQNITSYLTFNSLLFRIGYDDLGQKENTYYKTFLEPCDSDKHFVGKAKMFSNKSFGIPLSNSLCLNPTKILYKNNTLNENDPNLRFYNRYNTWNSAFMSISIKPCNSTRDNKICSQNEVIYIWLTELNPLIFIPDYYIDLSDYSYTAKPLVQSISLAV
jgi:hypothetical protein